MAKLRILCLHGTETTAEIMRWQMRSFQQTYGEIAELVFLDAPHQTGRPRYKPFRDRNFPAPYRKWFELEVDVFYKTQDKFDITYVEETLHLMQETVQYLA